MWLNYLKIAFRNLLKNKAFAGINILGLAMGLACCLLIVTYILDAVSYDSHHKDGDHIYRVGTEFTFGENATKTGSTPSPLARAIKEDFPEVLESARLVQAPQVEKYLIRYEEEAFYETSGMHVDSTYFQVLTYRFLEGDAKHCLDAPFQAVISDEMSRKLFGQASAIGKTLKVESLWGEETFKVTGVFEKGAYKSHIEANFFMSAMSGGMGARFYRTTEWAGNNLFFTYIKLRPDADPEALEAKLPEWLDGYLGNQAEQMGFSKVHFLEPLKDIYLKSEADSSFAAIGPSGDITYLYLLGSLAIFILLIACINFMNLTTAKATIRAHEVGIRKVVGATRRALLGQFMTETLVFTLIAVVIAHGLSELALPYFNRLFGASMEVDLWTNMHILPWMLLFILFTTFLAGFYPAIYLSSFRPVSIFKGTLGQKLSVRQMRKGLVVLQFIISIALIQGALVINEQMEYVKNTNLGFDASTKIILPLSSNEAADKYKSLKQELLKDARIREVGATTHYPGIYNINDMILFGEGQAARDGRHAFTTYAEPDYLDMMDFELVSGRKFSKDRVADTMVSTVVNETLAKGLGYTPETAIGKPMSFEWQGQRVDYTIIGVLKDFHHESLHQEIDGYGFFWSLNGGLSYLIAEVESSDLSGLLTSMEKSWQQVNPDEPFAYHFFDENLEKSYLPDLRISGLIRWGTGLAILISCLGLLGLATFAAERRMKEIGVRKVLGASVENIVGLLSREFIILIVIALVISTPLAWYAMTQWLQNFHYHIDMPWWVFLVAGILAILVAAATISWQAIQAARSNPVKALRMD